MKMLTNKQNIDKISFNYTVSCYCSVGEKFYVAKVSCTVWLGEWYPEYVDLTEWFKSINGEKYSIEELCEAVYDKLAELSPRDIEVTVEGNSPLHLPVVCTKESF